MPPWPPAFADVAAALRGVERWLLPPSCLLCGEPVPEREDDALVCALCRLRWRPVPHPLCARCGQPRDRDAACLLCADWPDGLARVRSAVWLEGSAREAAHRLKYDGWWRAAEPMADAMVPAARCLGALTGEVSLVPSVLPVPSLPVPTIGSASVTVPILVPVPLGRRRERSRGYNQSERLARALGRRLGVPTRPELLGRARETRSQTALTPEERRVNVAGAFEAARADGMVVVLVDDVFTTGATLLAAAAALIGAGAARVEAVTFARAATPVAGL